MYVKFTYKESHIHMLNIEYMTLLVFFWVYSISICQYIRAMIKIIDINHTGSLM